MWKRIRSLVLCRGKHQCIMHFLREKKVWECARCRRLFAIPESLTRSSGSFTAEARERAREILHADQARLKAQGVDQLKTKKKGA